METKSKSQTSLVRSGVLENCKILGRLHVHAGFFFESFFNPIGWIFMELIFRVRWKFFSEVVFSCEVFFNRIG